MSQEFIVTHDGDILGKGLTATEAVLLAATYDGWGAEFQRDEHGGMGLRRSARHIGNNAWLASGDEPAVGGINSALEDDDAAIEECVQGLIVDIETLHRLMEVKEVDDFIVERLQFALEAYEGDTGPGDWSVDKAARASTSGPRRPALCYHWPDDMTEDDAHWGDSDAPWKKWGGDAIIASAGCTAVDGIAVDGYDCCLVTLK